MVLVLCTLPNTAIYFLAKFWRMYLKRFFELRTQTVGSTVGWWQFTKGHNSKKSVNGVMVLNLCISSDDGLYLYQVSRQSLKTFQLLSGKDLYTEICKGA